MASGGQKQAIATATPTSPQGTTQRRPSKGQLGTFNRAKNLRLARGNCQIGEYPPGETYDFGTACANAFCQTLA
jgi:hypothetical protein